MFVALLPVNPVFVLLISCESLMKKRGYLISTPSVLLKQLACVLFFPFCFHRASKGSRVESVSNGDGGNQITTSCALSLFLKRTTAAFNKHVIRGKTAGCGVADGAVAGVSAEGTTHTDGSLFQHLVMHIAQNFIPMLNNQYKQYRCCYFS